MRNVGTFLGGRRHPIKIVFVSQLQTSHVDDFLRVPVEVRQAVEDGREDGFVEPLNPPPFGELDVGRVLEDLLNLVDCLSQPTKEFGLWNHITLGEFLWSVAGVGPLGHSVDDPLFDIAAQVQNDVGDAIHVLSRSPPNLFVGQLVDAMLDFSEPGIQTCLALLQEELTGSASCEHIAVLSSRIKRECVWGATKDEAGPQVTTNRKTNRRVQTKTKAETDKTKNRPKRQLHCRNPKHTNPKLKRGQKSTEGGSFAAALHAKQKIKIPKPRQAKALQNNTSTIIPKRYFA